MLFPTLQTQDRATYVIFGHHQQGQVGICRFIYMVWVQVIIIFIVIQWPKLAILITTSLPESKSSSSIVPAHASPLKPIEQHPQSVSVASHLHG